MARDRSRKSRNTLRAQRASAARRSLAEPLESRTLLSAGDPDPTFGTGGVTFPAFTVPGTSRPEAVAVAPGNKVVIAGSARLSVDDPSQVPALGRLNADGSPDASFGGDGWVRINSNVIPRAVAVQSDGKVVTAGSNPAGGSLVVTRHNPDGTPDTLFAGDGEAEFFPAPTSFPAAADLEILPDGRIVVVGGNDSVWAVRINPGGSLDANFGFGGVNVINPTNGPDRPEALEIDGEGRVLIAGTGGVNMPTQRAFVARLNTFGRADTTFGGGDGIADDFGPQPSTGLAVRPVEGGKVLVAGAATGGDYLARLNADGTEDEGFGAGGFVQVSPSGLFPMAYESMEILPDGRWVLAGPGPEAPIGNNHVYVHRYLPTGARDTAFGEDGRTLVALSFGDPDLMDLAVAPDGSLVGVARYTGNGGLHRAAAFRLTPDGDPDPSFGNLANFPGVAEPGFPVPVFAVLRAAAETLDGKLMVVGTSGGSQLVARFNADGSLDTTFDSDGWRTFALPGGVALIRALEALPDGSFVAAGERADQIVLLRLTAAGVLDNSFGGPFGGGVVTTLVSGATLLTVPDLAVQPDGKYVVVAAAQEGSILNRTSTTVVARYNADGSRDTTFSSDGMVRTDMLPGRNPEGSETARAVVVLPDGRIVVGAETYMDSPGSRSWAFAGYLPDGTIDTTTFGNPIVGQGVVRVRPSEGPGAIGDMRALPDGGFLVAGTGRFGTNDEEMLLVKFLPDGTWDPAFADNGFAHVNFGGRAYDEFATALDVQADGKIVLGGPARSAPAAAERVYAAARLNPDGTPDDSFGDAGFAVTAPTSPQTMPMDMVLTSAGRIVFVGAEWPVLVALTADADTVAPTARGVFYNDSAFDGRNTRTTPADVNAIASDKQALRPGQTASFSNVTSYTKGLNGIVVQFDGVPPAELVAGDFVFRAGNNADPSTWTAAPVPTWVGLIHATGNNAGATRYAITFANYAVRNTWLQVTVKANARTGLSSPDVFYFGNLPGDTGSLPLRVDVIDYVRTRYAANTGAAINSPVDFDRNGRVNANDIAAARANNGRSLARLAPPATAAVAVSADAAPVARRRSVYAGLMEGAA